MTPSPTATWLSLTLAVGEILDVHVEETRSDLFDGGDGVDSGAHGVADVDAAADAGIHVI